MFSLAWYSLKYRRSTVLLTILSLTLAIALLLGVERLRSHVKSSFENTLSSTDLIVGGRTGQLNLLLYSIFRIGNATNNIDWKTVRLLEKHRDVDWIVPISLGDSHQGFSVLGTDNRYFQFYRYGNKQPLILSEGEQLNRLGDVVIGAQVASQLNYRLGTPLNIAHGLVDTPFNRHKNLQFNVVGILAPTGTPVDKTLHVSLAALDAVHAPVSVSHSSVAKDPLPITAVLLGVTSKLKLFALQRYLNTYALEPLTAIIPAMALQELWLLLGSVERLLQLISVFVVVLSFLGLLTILLLAQKERRREMAILRVMGARPQQLLFLLTLEAMLLTFISIVCALLLLGGVWYVIGPIIERQYGLQIPIQWIQFEEWKTLLGVQVLGTCIGVIPAFFSYRRSLHDGIALRI